MSRAENLRPLDIHRNTLTSPCGIVGHDRAICQELQNRVSRIVNKYFKEIKKAEHFNRSVTGSHVVDFDIVKQRHVIEITANDQVISIPRDTNLGQRGVNIVRQVRAIWDEHRTHTRDHGVTDDDAPRPHFAPVGGTVGAGEEEQVTPPPPPPPLAGRTDPAPKLHFIPVDGADDDERARVEPPSPPPPPPAIADIERVAGDSFILPSSPLIRDGLELCGKAQDLVSAHNQKGGQAANAVQLHEQLGRHIEKIEKKLTEHPQIQPLVNLRERLKVWQDTLSKVTADRREFMYFVDIWHDFFPLTSSDASFEGEFAALEAQYQDNPVFLGLMRSAEDYTHRLFPDRPDIIFGNLSTQDKRIILRWALMRQFGIHVRFMNEESASQLARLFGDLPEDIANFILRNYSPETTSQEFFTVEPRQNLAKSDAVFGLIEASLRHDLGQYISHLTARVASTADELKKAQAALAAAEARVEELRREAATRQPLIDGLEDRTAAATAALTAHQVTIARLEGELSTARAQQRDTSAELEAARSEAAATAARVAEITSLQAQYSEAAEAAEAAAKKAHVFELAQQKTELEAIIAKHKAAHEQAVSDLEAAHRIARGTTVAELDAARVAAARLGEELAAATVRVAALSETGTTQADRIAALAATQREQTIRAAALERELAAARAQQDGTAAELAATRAAATAGTTAHAAARADADRLQEQLATTTARIDTLSGSGTEQKARIAALEVEQAAQTTRAAALAEELATARAQQARTDAQFAAERAAAAAATTTHEAEIAAAEAEAARLQKQLATATARIDTLSGSDAEQKARIAALEVEQAAQTTRAAELTKTLEAAQTTQSGTADELAAARIEAARLTAEAAGADAIHEAAIAEAREKTARLQEKLAEATASVAALTEKDAKQAACVTELTATRDAQTTRATELAGELTTARAQQDGTAAELATARAAAATAATDHKAAIAAAEAEVARLRSELAVAIARVDALSGSDVEQKDRIAALEVEQAAQTTRAAELTRQLEAAQTTQSGTATELAAARASVAAHEAAIAAAEAAAARLQGQLRESIATAEALLKSDTEKATHIAALIATRDAQTTRAAELTRQLEDSREQQARTTAELAATRAAATAGTTAHAAARADADRLQEQLATTTARIETLSGSDAEQKARIAALEVEQAAQTTRAAALAEELATARAQQARTDAQFAAERAAAAAATTTHEAEIAAAEAEAARLQKQLATATARIDTLSGSDAEQKARIAALEVEQAAQTTRAAELTKTLEAAQTTQSGTADELAAARAEATRLGTASEAAQREAAAAKAAHDAAITAARADVDRLREALATATASVAAHDAAIAAATTRTAALEATQHAQAERIAELEGDLEAARRDAAAAQAEARERAAALESTSAASQAHIAELEETLATVRAEQGTAAAELSAARAEATRLDTALEAAQRGATAAKAVHDAEIAEARTRASALEATQQTQAARIAELTAAQAEAREKEAALERTSAERQARIAELEKTLAGVRAEKDTTATATALAAATAEAAELARISKADAAARVGEIARQREALEAAHEAAVATREAAHQAELAELQARYTQTSLAELERQEAALKAAHASELDGLRATHAETMRRTQEASEAIVATTAKETAELRKQLEEAQEGRRKVAQELGTATQTLTESQRDLSSLRARQEEAARQFTTLHTRLAKIRGEAEQQTKEIPQRKQEAADLRADLGKVEAEKRALQAKLEELEALRATDQASRAAAEGQLHALRQQLAEREEALAIADGGRIVIDLTRRIDPAALSGQVAAINAQLAAQPPEQKNPYLNALLEHFPAILGGALDVLATPRPNDYEIAIAQGALSEALGLPDRHPQKTDWAINLAIYIANYHPEAVSPETRFALLEIVATPACLREKHAQLRSLALILGAPGRINGPLDRVIAGDPAAAAREEPDRALAPRRAHVVEPCLDTVHEATQGGRLRGDPTTLRNAVRDTILIRLQHAGLGWATDTVVEHLAQTIVTTGTLPPLFHKVLTQKNPDELGVVAKLLWDYVALNKQPKPGYEDIADHSSFGWLHSEDPQQEAEHIFQLMHTIHDSPDFRTRGDEWAHPITKQQAEWAAGIATLMTKGKRQGDVIARAGSGKTTTIAMAIEFCQKYLDPSSRALFLSPFARVGARQFVYGQREVLVDVDEATFERGVVIADEGHLLDPDVTITLRHGSATREAVFILVTATPVVPRSGYRGFKRKELQPEYRERLAEIERELAAVDAEAARAVEGRLQVIAQQKIDALERIIGSAMTDAEAKTHGKYVGKRLETLRFLADPVNRRRGDDSLDYTQALCQLMLTPSQRKGHGILQHAIAVANSKMVSPIPLPSLTITKEMFRNAFMAHLSWQQKGDKPVRALNEFFDMIDPRPEELAEMHRALLQDASPTIARSKRRLEDRRLALLGKLGKWQDAHDTDDSTRAALTIEKATSFKRINYERVQASTDLHQVALFAAERIRTSRSTAATQLIFPGLLFSERTFDQFVGNLAQQIHEPVAFVFQDSHSTTGDRKGKKWVYAFDGSGRRQIHEFTGWDPRPEERVVILYDATNMQGGDFEPHSRASKEHEVAQFVFCQFHDVDRPDRSGHLSENDLLQIQGRRRGESGLLSHVYGTQANGDLFLQQAAANQRCLQQLWSARTTAGEIARKVDKASAMRATEQLAFGLEVAEQDTQHKRRYKGKFLRMTSRTPVVATRAYLGALRPGESFTRHTASDVAFASIQVTEEEDRRNLWRAGLNARKIDFLAGEHRALAT